MKSRLMHAIAIELQPSKLLLGLLCAISIVACVILAQLPVAIAIKLALIGLVLSSSAYFILRDALLLLPISWKSVEVNTQSRLKVTNKMGETFEPTLAASSLIHHKMTILNFRHWRLPSVILFTSQANQEELRKLRVWMRWANAKPNTKAHQTRDDEGL